MQMRTIDPKSIPTKDLHQYIVGSIAPRPIAFVSTIDEEGIPNLAPYSFFNAFSSNPPIFVFSSNRRVSNNTTKDTLANVMATREVVINMVNHDIVRQMAITSVEFDSDVNEFEKSGLTQLKSDIVKPFRVAESPVHYECKVNDIITLGAHGGAGHLIICEVVKLHINEAVLDERNRINPHKLDLMGRMGRAYYVRAKGDAIQTIVQGVVSPAIGYDQLPEAIRTSATLTGNDIGMLAGLAAVPTKEEVHSYLSENTVLQNALESTHPERNTHLLIKELLAQGKREEAGLCAWVMDYGL